MTEILERSDAGGVHVLRIARPPVNALDLATLEALHAAFNELVASPPKHGLAFVSSNGHFSAGLTNGDPIWGA